MEENKIIFQLIKNNKFDDFKKMLIKNEELDLNFKDETGNYLIIYAIIKNNPELISLMLKKGCRIDINDQEGKSILYLPIKYSYNEIIKLLIDYDKNAIGISIIDFKDKSNNIPLHYAIFFQNNHAIDILLEADSNPNLNDQDGNNSLHLAIYTKNLDICKKIIKSDVNINSKTQLGETALHIACNFQLFDIVRLLVESNIDINVQDYNNEITALIYSINLNDNKTSKYLLYNGADPNIQDFLGNTAIHYSIIEENNEMVFELLTSNKIKIKPNINIHNINEKLPIHLLLEKDVVYENNIINELLSQSNLNFQDNNGNTPFHLICKKKLWKSYKEILMKKKLNVFIKNYENERPIDYIHKNEINEFIDLVTNSYLYTLRNYNFVWKENWENLCNKELFYGELNPDEIKIIKEYVIEKSIMENNKVDICFKIVNDKINNIYKNNGGTCDHTSYPQKRNRKCISIGKANNVEMCTFTGITLDILIGLVYLLHKYDYACSTITTNFIINKDLCNYFSNIGYKTNIKCEFLNFEIVWIYKKLFFSENFANNFKKCISNTKTRFIIIPLGIELKEGSHANYLIFDKKTFEIERFEPYGFGSPYKFNYSGELLDKILSFKFTEIAENIKYVTPRKFLPKIGFQYLDIYESKTKKIGDPGGFCAVWSIWYTDMRLKYPDVERKSLVNKLMKEIKLTNISFKNLIRNYSLNIVTLRDQIFKKVGITINDWLNDQYTDDQFKNIISEITIMLSN